MPLLDHFCPPLDGRPPWETVRRGWLERVVTSLGALAPPESYRTFVAINGDEHGLARPVVVEPPQPDAIPPVATVHWDRVDEFNIHVVNTEPFGRLRGVVEVVSEDIKRSERERRTFAAKCMIHLRDGANVVMVDAITSLPFNLHNELMRYCGVRSPRAMLPEVGCYVAAYRYHTDVHRMESRHYHVAVGQPIPTMPLFLRSDFFVPIDFETTYLQALTDHNL